MQGLRTVLMHSICRRSMIQTTFIALKPKTWTQIDGRKTKEGAAAVAGHRQNCHH